MSLPESPLPATKATGQPTSNPLTDSVIEAAVRDAIHQTSWRDDTPLPVVGTAPPVAQPGRPPMSQGATDASVVMLSAGATTTMIGGTTAVVMYVSQYANPLVCGIVFGAPAVLALALGCLAKRAKGVLPDEHHHHYNGPVHQDHHATTNKTKAVIAKTINNPEEKS